MILIVSEAKNAVQCIPVIQKTTGERVQLASKMRPALAMLRSREFSVVLVDQACLEQGASFADALWKNAGTAIPLTANFAIHNAERIAREVRSALLRRDRDRVLAARVAKDALRNELNSAVAGILLTSEIALAQPALPSSVASKLQSVHELALHMKSCLSVVS